MDHSPGFLRLSEAARARVRETDADTVQSRLERGDDFHLLDVREDSEWAAGHLPGAVHLGRGVLERDIERLIPDRDAEIVLYCGGGYRSALAADSLQQMGYSNVLSLAGGWTGWTEAGKPVERTEAD
jgi:rhodanese-related sulfurtransferase